MTKDLKEYILKLYDIELVRFTAQINQFGELNISVKDVNETCRHLLPAGMLTGVTADSIKEWLEGRVIPKNRQFVYEILSMAGLSVGDTLGIIDVCKGLSVNDSFWVDDVESQQKYQDINLYDNKLDEALALVAYTGVTDKQKHKVGLSTEWTMSGQFAKAWRRINDQLVLYKGGTEGFSNAGMEPYSEYFAAQLAQAIGLDVVSYDLDKWKGRLASTCSLLNTKDISFVPFWQIAGQSRFPKSLAAGLVMGDKIFESMRSMIVFDALICNVDRHAGNYGCMRDNRTGEVLGMAPLFDHNLSLFARDTERDFANWPQRANEVMLPRTSNLTFKEESELVMGPRQHEMLRKAIGFQFVNHPRYPIADERLEALNKYLTARTDELLRIPMVSEKNLQKGLLQSIDQQSEPIPAVLVSELAKEGGMHIPSLKDRVKETQNVQSVVNTQTQDQTLEQRQKGEEQGL